MSGNSNSDRRFFLCCESCKFKAIRISAFKKHLGTLKHRGASSDKENNYYILNTSNGEVKLKFALEDLKNNTTVENIYRKLHSRYALLNEMLVDTVESNDESTTEEYEEVVDHRNPMFSVPLIPNDRESPLERVHRPYSTNLVTFTLGDSHLIRQIDEFLTPLIGNGFQICLIPREQYSLTISPLKDEVANLPHATSNYDPQTPGIILEPATPR